MDHAHDEVSRVKEELGLFAAIREDSKAAGYRQHSALFIAAHLLSSSGLLAVTLYRVSHRLNRGGRVRRALARALCRINEFINACELNVHAEIGAGLYLPHPYGVVIGKHSKIGAECTIYQNVTLGMRHSRGATLADGYPTLGNNVVVSAGAVICGPIEIGDGAVVGANSVVLTDVPKFSRAVGVPARILQNK